ncbi:chitinase-3-like protein 1 [Armigeres subalbatus]|uniref:chitinase-3-like protein 1 n=1 Tax=Armigeres subalbatus TaxID=124917 RepID=UPI002ED52635
MVTKSECVLSLILALSCAAFAQKNVVCYYASWATYRAGRGQFNVDDIDPNLCTHLAYAFFGLLENGTISILDPWLDLDSGRGNIRLFNELKNVNPSLKTLAAIGGYNQQSEIFSKVAANPALRQAFAEDARDFCLLHGFDGVDIGWEFPGQRGGDPVADRENFVLMLADLKQVLSANGLILTGALAAAQNIAETAYNIPLVSQHLDFINLMAYDFNGAWNSFTGHNSPLFAGPADSTDFQRTLNVDHSVSYWLQQGAPASKINLGVPHYGRTFTLENKANHWLRANAIGPGSPGFYTQEEGALAYYEICENFSSGSWAQFWDSDQKIPFGVINDQWIGYDNEETTTYKCNYILQHNLAGGMVWSMDQDDFRGNCGPKFALLSALQSCLN